MEDLRKLFASTYAPFSNNPESFQIWEQSSDSEHGVMVLIVDMDRLETEDIEKNSSDLQG